MNSSDLLAQGFRVWQRFAPQSEGTLIPSLPAARGVYVIRSKQSFGRFIGEADIVYIGSATNKGGLKQRIRQYFHPGPTQWTNRRILDLIKWADDFELSFVECETANNATNMEKRLLDQYYAEHGEFPPQNRRG